MFYLKPISQKNLHHKREIQLGSRAKPVAGCRRIFNNLMSSTLQLYTCIAIFQISWRLKHERPSWVQHGNRPHANREFSWNTLGGLDQPESFLNPLTCEETKLGTETQLASSLRLKHEAAWGSTFSCLRTSQTRDSAGFQVSLSKNQLSLQMSVYSRLLLLFC
ncbi:hypothetical protein T265_01040 [Opisthorchis viverrini]|uniref:Uncharacterized protein n=1 Tax=Opisthorchis viverrini TaxID=6198 RepID=A0A075A3T8_OPIVI|nr:hypothetical protein T265_01040 [Opisthorchis viverrini]KER32947.1 hypothetical protein T265_01040 [Opisthorchis viverrini]